MNLAWLRKFDGDEESKQTHIQGLKYSWQLDLLQDILTDMKSKEERAEQSPDSYDSPNWAYRQADRNGYMRCLNSILTLLDQRKQ